MKKVFFIVAVATLFFSCQKENNSKSPTEVFTFKASIEKFTELTKAVLNNNAQLVWAEGDEIGIYVNNPDWEQPHQPFTLKEGDGGSTSGEFVWRFGDFTDPNATIAYFPWEQDGENNFPGSWQNNVYDGKVFFKLHDEYWSYKTGKMLTPLVASLNGSTDPISFKHAGAAVKVTIENLPAGAYYITMTADKQITGSYYIDPTKAGTDALALDGSSDLTKNTVKLNYGDSSEERSFTFVFPVPTLTTPVLTFEIVDKNGISVWSKTTPAQPSLNRADVLEMPSIKITPYSQFNKESDVWTFCGNINGGAWVDDIPMITDTEGKYCILAGFTFNEGDAFRIRKNKNWDEEAYPAGSGNNWVFTSALAGAKDIIFNTSTHEIKVIDHRCPYPTVDLSSDINIDGDMSDWALVQGETNGNHTVKVASDETNVYFYSHRTADTRYPEIWNKGGYIYIGLDLDNDATTGDGSINTNGPYEFVTLIWPYGGNSETPDFYESPQSDWKYSPSSCSIDNLKLKGVADSSNGVEIEFSIPRNDLPTIPSGPVTIKFFGGSKGLNIVTLSRTL